MALCSSSTVEDYLKLRHRLREEKRSIPIGDLGTFGSFFGPSKPTFIPQRVLQETANIYSSLPKKPAAKKAELMRKSRDYSFLSSSSADPVLPAATSPKPQASAAVVPSRKSPGLLAAVLSNRDPWAKKPENRDEGEWMNNSRSDYSFLPTVTNISPTGPKPLRSLAHLRKGNSKKLAVSRNSGSKSMIANKEAKVVIPKETEKKNWNTAPVSQNSGSKPRMKAKVVIKPKEQSAPAAAKRKREDEDEWRPRKRATRDEEDEVELRLRKKAAAMRRREEEEGEKAISMIRRMMGYNPDKYRDRDCGDDRDMEARFHDIVKEEKRSARIAQKEDAEELRKIEEDERKERLRKKQLSSKR